MSAWERALRYETVMLHRDQHKDVAKSARLFGPYFWCFVCGFTPNSAKR